MAPPACYGQLRAGGVTVQKWLIDGLIGWGAVAALTFIVSLSTPNEYSFSSSLLYSLGLGLVIGAIGGVIIGRNQVGWAWPFAGGVLFALVLGVILMVFRKT